MKLSALVIALSCLTLVVSCGSQKFTKAKERELANKIDDAYTLYYEDLEDNSTIDSQLNFIRVSDGILSNIGARLSYVNNNFSETNYLNDSMNNIGTIETEMSTLEKKVDKVRQYCEEVSKYDIEFALEANLKIISSNYKNIITVNVPNLNLIIKGNREKLTAAKDSIRKFVDKKIAEISDLSRTEDYDKMIEIAKSIGKYECRSSDIGNMIKSSELGKEGKSNLIDKSYEQALASYQRANNEFKFDIFSNKIASMAEMNASIYYSRAKSNANSRNPEKLTESLNDFRKVMSFKENYKDSRQLMDKCIAVLMDAYLVKAKKYENEKKWGNAILERHQALNVDDQGTLAETVKKAIETDKGNLVKDKMLQLVLVPQSGGDNPEEAPAFYSSLFKDVKDDNLFSSQQWKCLANNPIEGKDVKKLSKSDLKMFDLMIQMTLTTLKSEGPTPMEEEKSKEFVLKYHKEPNPKWDTWKDTLNVLKSTYDKEPRTVKIGNKTMDNWAKGAALLAYNIHKDSEPDKKIDVPDYADAIWKEIAWEQVVSIDVQGALSYYSPDGELNEDSVSFFKDIKDSCLEIKPGKYADKVDVKGKAKSLQSISSMKKSIASMASDQLKQDITRKIEKIGLSITKERMNKAKELGTDDYIEYVMYMNMMYNNEMSSSDAELAINNVRTNYRIRGM